MPNVALPDHPIHELITARWSPYGFDERSVPRQILQSLFEAARWAPSSYNEQPWRYIVATRDDRDSHAKLLSCLVEGNQVWAKHAPVLMLGLVQLFHTRNNQPNPAARHDLGVASAHLTMEATSRGLVVHQMIGILPDKARELFGIPDGYEAVTALAVGYEAERRDLPRKLQERDRAPRRRRPIAEFVFGGEWGTPAKLVK